MSAINFSNTLLCRYVLLFGCIIIFFSVMSVDWYFYSIVKFAAKSALKENAELGVDLRNQTQNRKWQGTKQGVQVSLSWSGNLCTENQENPGQDLKSAPHQDEQGTNQSTVYSWCLSHSKPHSCKTQTGIVNPLCGILEDVKDGKVPMHRHRGVAGTSLAAGPQWGPSSQKSLPHMNQGTGNGEIWEIYSWSELKPDRCRCTL